MCVVSRRRFLAVTMTGAAGLAWGGGRPASPPPDDPSIQTLPYGLHGRAMMAVAAGSWTAGIALDAGGWISRLDHAAAGPVLCAGVAEDGEPLTPRIEWVEGGVRFNSLHDGANVIAQREADEVRLDIKTRLLGPGGRLSSAGHCPCDLQVRIATGEVSIEAFMTGGDGRLVVPVIVRATDTVERADGTTLRIRRAGTVLTVEGTTPLQVPHGLEGRIRGAASGLQALPVALAPCAAGRCRVTLRAST
jgi:hypothetical protein